MQREEELHREIEKLGKEGVQASPPSSQAQREQIRLSAELQESRREHAEAVRKYNALRETTATITIKDAYSNPRPPPHRSGSRDSGGSSPRGSSSPRRASEQRQELGHPWDKITLDQLVVTWHEASPGDSLTEAQFASVLEQLRVDPRL